MNYIIGGVITLIIIIVILYFVFSNDKEEEPVDLTNDIQIVADKEEALIQAAAAAEDEATELNIKNQFAQDKINAEILLKSQDDRAEAVAEKALLDLKEMDEMKNEKNQAIKNGNCGPSYFKVECTGEKTCNKIGKCGIGEDYQYKPYSIYGGPNSVYN